MFNLDRISFRYGKRDLFHNLSLKLDSGHIYGLLGKNGAGKTTLLKLLSGLLFPSSGTCNFDDIDVAKRKPEFLEKVFFLPEEFLLPPIKGSLFTKLRSGFYPNFDVKILEYCLKEFGLDIDKPLNTLSFGQKKKFLLSFGLATNTKVVIMDEPTNGLDIPSKTILRKIIAKLINSDRTFLISTHQVKDVENLIDQIIILDSGRVAFNESILDTSKKIEMREVKYLKGDELFSQEILGGYQVVSECREKSDNVIDLELLFNSVILNPDSINRVFKKVEMC